MRDSAWLLPLCMRGRSIPDLAHHQAHGFLASLASDREAQGVRYATGYAAIGVPLGYLFDALFVPVRQLGRWSEAMRRSDR